MVKEIPIWEKANLTVEEAAAYFGIGVNKIRAITDGAGHDCILWVGSKRLIKKKKFEQYLNQRFSI